ncbi:MAG: tyrosine--tRNA ligase [Bifidobacterium breve]
MPLHVGLGGSDQWGNLTSGLDLIHKVRGVDVNVFTSPIITDASGKKFGKSEGNAVWLDATMLSPYKFYQFWINRPDVEMESLLKAFTFLPKAEIEHWSRIQDQPRQARGPEDLAWEVTSFVHGEAATQAAIDASGALFGRGGNLEDIDEETLESVLDGFKVVDENGEHVFPVSKPGDRVIDAAQAAGLFKSASRHAAPSSPVACISTTYRG